jgi:tight adherence protein C
MPTTVLLIAGLAAFAVLLITYGLAGRQSRDVVQQRLEQLVVQPKSLEEMELQQPLAERVLRPMIQRLSRVANRGDSGGLIARADAKLEKAGYPGGLRGADWMGVKILSTIVLGMAVALIMLATGRVQLAFLFGIAGAGLGYMAPEFWLGGKARKRSWAMVL